MTNVGGDLDAAVGGVPTNGDSEAPGVWVRQPVCIAFQLGWDMARLYSVAVQRKPFEYQSGWKLPSQRDFTGSLHALDMERRLVAVSAGLIHMEGALDDAGIERPSARKLLDRYCADASEEQLRDAIYRLHLNTLIGLQAADPRLGSAYNLGRALCDTAIDSARPFSERFGFHRVNGLRLELVRLASSFPPHAAQAVARSLCVWRCVAGGRLDPKTETNLQGVMPRQAEAWRGLLSGEQRGADLLVTEDYLEAGRRLVAEAGSVVSEVVRGYRALVAVVAAIFVLGLVIILAIGEASGVIAGVALVGSALGVSWKGIATTLTALAHRLRAPLWGAEIDAAVGHAVTAVEGRRAYAKLPADARRCGHIPDRRRPQRGLRPLRIPRFLKLRSRSK